LHRGEEFPRQVRSGIAHVGLSSGTSGSTIEFLMFQTSGRAGGALSASVGAQHWPWRWDIFECGRPSPTGDTSGTNTARRRAERASHILYSLGT